MSKLFVFIPDLFTATGDMEKFFSKCRDAGATGIRIFFQYAWNDNILSPFKCIGNWKAGYPDAPDLPFYDQREWNSEWLGKIEATFRILERIWPNCEVIATLHDYCSFKESGWRKYLYPFLSSYPDYELDNYKPGGNLIGGFWGHMNNENLTTQHLHRRYAQKVIGLIKKFGFNFYVEFCNEDGLAGWDDGYVNSYYYWVDRMLHEEGLPIGKLIISGRYAAYVPGEIYCQHNIINSRQLNGINPPTPSFDRLLLSGDGGYNGGTGNPDAKGRRGLGVVEVKSLVVALKKIGAFGYEYMDRGLYYQNNDKACLDNFNDLPLIELAREFGLYEEPEKIFIQVEVCVESGLRPTRFCKHKEIRIFELGSEPTEICDLHQKPPLERWLERLWEKIFFRKSLRNRLNN